jgi:hypothetical protein
MKKIDLGRFPKTNELRESYFQEEYVMFKTHEDPELDPVLDIILEELSLDYVPIVSRAYLSEASSYQKRGIYYKGCRLVDYEKHYDERLKTYLKEYGEDCSEEDFIVDELNDLTVNTYLLDSHLEKTIGLSLRKTENFLKQKLSSLGFELKVISNDKGTAYDYKKNTHITDVKEEVGENLDLNLTCGGKIMLLQELGIIEFIEKKMKKGISMADTARILGKIIDENPDTAYQVINSMRNKTIRQKNNPYSGDKAAGKIAAVWIFLVSNGITET